MLKLDATRMRKQYLLQIYLSTQFLFFNGLTKEDQHVLWGSCLRGELLGRIQFPSPQKYFFFCTVIVHCTITLYKNGKMPYSATTASQNNTL